MNRSTRRWTRRVAAVFGVVGLAGQWLFSDRVLAYEWQEGPGRSCPGEQVAVSGFGYGDMNVYTNYGWVAGEYDVPFYSQNYVWGLSGHESTTKTAADAENNVTSVGSECQPK
jgi:hypothetical protein